MLREGGNFSTRRLIQGETVSETEKKPLIPSRVMLVGEEGIPRHLLDQLRDEQMQILLREPNPADWPADMRWLIDYLPPEERIRSRVAFAVSDKGNLLEDALERWTLSVCDTLAEQGLLRPQNVALILDEATAHLRALMAQWLAERCGPAPGKCSIMPAHGAKDFPTEENDS